MSENMRERLVDLAQEKYDAVLADFRPASVVNRERATYVVDAVLTALHPKLTTAAELEDLDALPENSLIEATGVYLADGGGFYDCWARPCPSYATGVTDPTDRLWQVLVFGNDSVPGSLTSTSRITSARILYRPATEETRNV